jgi:phenylacetate-coenzyme A ligase PaaK-like adenylate-forming protein
MNPRDIYFHGYTLDTIIGFDKSNIENFKDEQIKKLLNIKEKNNNIIYTKEDHKKEKKSRKNGNIFHTSGTTGEPFRFLYSVSQRSFYISYLYKKICYIYNVDYNKCIFLHIVPFRLINMDLKELSSFSSTISNFIVIRDTFLEKFNKMSSFSYDKEENFYSFSPNCNIILVSPYSMLEKIIDESLLQNPIFKKIRLVISVAEHIIDKNRLSDYFKCPIVDWITCYDGTFSAWNCPYGNYHIDPEVCDAWSDDQNRLIVTDYWNYNEVFYNYWNGDMGIVDKTSKCECGVNSHLLTKFFGRETETFYLKDKKIYGIEIYDTLFGGLNWKETWVEQDEKGEITFYYSKYDEEKMKKVDERLKFLFGDKNYEIKMKQYDKNTSLKSKRIFSNKSGRI